MGEPDKLQALANLHHTGLALLTRLRFFVNYIDFICIVKLPRPLFYKVLT